MHELNVTHKLNRFQHTLVLKYLNIYYISFIKKIKSKIYFIRKKKNIKIKSYYKL